MLYKVGWISAGLAVIALLTVLIGPSSAGGSTSYHAFILFSAISFGSVISALLLDLLQNMDEDDET